MTQYLNGNWILWGQGFDGFSTTFDGGSTEKTYDCQNFLRNAIELKPPTLNKIPSGLGDGYPTEGASNMLHMDFGGTFMGIIVYFDLNSFPATTHEFEFIKTTGLGTVIERTGVICSVGTAPGFYATNTDVAEFTRTFEPLEFISCQLTKGTSSNNGLGPGTMIMCLDLDLAPPGHTDP